MTQVDTRHQFDCKHCGSQLTYHVGSDELKCEGCSHTEKTLTPLREIREWSLDEALELVSTDSVNRLTKLSEIGQHRVDEDELIASVEINCKKCGAVLEWSRTKHSGRCDYCDSSLTFDDEREKRNPIEALIPFVLKKIDAERAFGDWVGKRWFAPNALKNMQSHIKNLRGVYIPHWTFDTDTYTEYTGKRGEYYYVTVERTRMVDGELERYSAQERRTNWYPASGIVRLSFDDILVLASFVAPRKIVERLEPWPLAQAKPYDEAYLAGLGSEYYQLPLGEAFYRAKQQISGDIHRAVCHDIGGDEQVIHSQQTQYDNNTYKLMLMPVWVSAFQYKDRDYVTLINGATGEVQGQYPKSAGKFAFAIIIALIVIGTSLYFAWPYIEAELARQAQYR